MNKNKTFWVGTSWKMNKTLSEALEFATALKQDEVNVDSGYSVLLSRLLPQSGK